MGRAEAAQASSLGLCRPDSLPPSELWTRSISAGLIPTNRTGLLWKVGKPFWAFPGLTCSSWAGFIGCDETGTAGPFFKGRHKSLPLGFTVTPAPAPGLAQQLWLPHSQVTSLHKGVMVTGVDAPGRPGVQAEVAWQDVSLCLHEKHLVSSACTP